MKYLCSSLFFLEWVRLSLTNKFDHLRQLLVSFSVIYSHSFWNFTLKSFDKLIYTNLFRNIFMKKL